MDGGSSMCRPASILWTSIGWPRLKRLLRPLSGRVKSFFQQPVQYNDTAAANIRFGDLHLSDSEFVDALKSNADASGLNEIIARLPDSYDTILGRSFLDGTELSVGEWHRLALVRATIRKAQILVLDEPTSAMDPWAELNWVEHLREVAGNRITILITHRFTTAMFADVIHVISDGHVVESGNHAELIARNGMYAEGWAMHAKL
jgi:ATP-binding cassette subfamily B protein